MKDSFLNASGGMSVDTRTWIDGFRARHGRPPRVLHIGNIANNAYNNAKILNAVGIDSDVICYDYYHIMGCPEWEDADFEANDLDHFKPNWTAVNLGGFERPRWFAQGPQQLCIDYLIAKWSGDSRRANSLWQQLGYVNRTARIGVINSFMTRLSCRLVQHKARARRLMFAHLSHENVYALILNKLGILETRYGVPGFFAAAAIVPLAFLGVVVMQLLGGAFLLTGRICKQKYFMESKDATVDAFDFNARCEELIGQFPKLFPERADQLNPADLAIYGCGIVSWRRLFACYDIIQGYATDGIYPLLADVPYVAFEHGTIRDIPYNATAQGRLTALTYCLANHVLVTNFDCRQSADFLAPERYTLINHPYDEDHGMAVEGWKELRHELMGALDSEFLFFFPTRQDWVTGTGYADKSNDVFLRAFAQLRAEGYSVGLICCEWGANVADSQALLQALGDQDHVRWVAPMAMVRFERMAKACDCVVDQFKLGAFGGVLFKAMSVGAPVLTYLDEQRLQEQYEEVPPVINCHTEAEIVKGMRQLIEHPDLLSSKSRESRNWIKKFHGKSEMVAAQVKQYSRLLPI